MFTWADAERLKAADDAKQLEADQRATQQAYENRDFTPEFGVAI